MRLGLLVTSAELLRSVGTDLLKLDGLMECQPVNGLNDEPPKQLAEG